MTGVFEVLAADHSEERTTKRVATRLAHKRVTERFAKFVQGAATPAERKVRVLHVEDHVRDLVTATCREHGIEDTKSISDVLLKRLASECDCGGDCQCGKKTASVHESRRPKVCPYHKEVMDISLAQGEPRAGFDAMAQHAWGPQHCQGGEYEGRCNFKAEMTTQSYWDTKAEQREQRREEREQQRAEQAELETPVEEAPVDDEGNVEGEDAGLLLGDESGDGDNVVDFPTDGTSAVGEGVEAEPQAVAASVDDRAPLAERTAASNDVHESTDCPNCGSDNTDFHYNDVMKCKNCGETWTNPQDPDLYRKGRTAEQKEHLKGVDSDKRQRQYEHIKEQCLSDGKGEEECKELAARTVNKQRAEKGETKGSSHQALKTADYWGPGGDPDPGARRVDDFDSEEVRIYEAQLLEEGYAPEEAHQMAIEQASIGGPNSPEVNQSFGENPFGPRRGGSRIAEALETVDVTKGGEDPIPKMDKRKWTPENIQDRLDTEGEGSPNPTREVDILEPIAYDNNDDPFEQTDAVLEKQDADKDTGPKPESGGSWGTSNGVNPVSSAVDVTKNPIREILLEDDDGFASDSEVTAAVARSQ